MATDLERVVFGNHPDPDGEPEPVDTVVVEGVVKSVDTKGMMFTVPTWDGGKYEFGPAPWPKVFNTQFTTTSVELHTHDATATETLPVKGDRCLVVFPGGVPWVIGWWPK
jgi:hypothetical protein